MLIDEINSGESNSLEFKENLPENSIKYMKTVVAFSNCNGGKIIFGVKDKTREIVGIAEDNPFSVMDTITNSIADSCEPMIIPDISIQTINNKTVIVVEILSGNQKPYYIKSKGIEKGIYIRTSGTTRPAEKHIIKELLLDGSNSFFDQLPAKNQKVTEVDIENLCNEMTQYAQKMCTTKEEKRSVKKLSKNTLLSWGLLIEKKHSLLPTYSFCLLSGSELPNIKSEIQCAVFKGTNRTVFIDKKTYYGSLQNQIEEAYNFILRSIETGAAINGLYRQDVYELPLSAIREAIVNAVCHRSYLEPSNVQVALYDNRLEITSPGMLMNGVSISKMKEGYSKIRNRGIANAFLYMKIIENWGSGIPRIFQACLDYGLPEPELIDFDGDFKLVIYRKNNKPDQTNKKTDQTVLKTDQTFIHLDDNSVILLNAIRENPKATQKEYSLITGWKINRIKYYIKKLQDMGIIVREGTNRKGQWKIIN